jgi:PAS domain S-box-containing protein/TyrR family helix-turn-helix protein
LNSSLIQIGLPSLLNSISNSILLLDTSGEIQFCNEAAMEVFQLESKLVVGRHYVEVFKEINILHLLERGKHDKEKGLVENYKIKINNKTYVVSGMAIMEQKELVGSIIIIQDISQFDFLAEELQFVKKLNLEMNTIINNSYDGIWVFDGNGNTLRVNKTYEKFSGIAAKDLIGQNIKELVKKGFFSDSAAMHVLEKNKTSTVIHNIMTGKRAMVTAVPVFDENDQIWRIIANVRDISELMQLKEKIEEIEIESKRYREELEEIKISHADTYKMVFKSKKMREIVEVSQRIAKVDSTILILGESGVGKGIIASFIHEMSERNRGPFVKINCGALPENILESELFGYEKGTFTGGLKEGKSGLIELAKKGTLFLDEVAELPLQLQAKLLQVIQEKTYYRVGGRIVMQADIRIIAATNRSLIDMVKNGTFREDLYYRLNVVPITMPPLKERREDIPLLIYKFLSDFNEKYKQEKVFHADLVDELVAYEWPGNVRELENLIERLVVTIIKKEINVFDLPQDYKALIQNQPSFSQPPSYSQRSLPESYSLKEELEKFEKSLIKNMLDGQNSYRYVAKKLGIHHTNLIRKIKKYQLEK